MFTIRSWIYLKRERKKSMADYKGVSGALYTNNYKNGENHPDYTGEVDLSKEVIDAIREQMENKVNSKGDPIDLDGETGFPKIALAGWVRQGKKGEFFSIKASPIFVKKKEGSDDIPF